MLNTFPMAGVLVPVPDGITHIYNDTKTLTGDLIAGDLILTDTTISTGGYRIYCKSLTMNGSTLQNDGSNASTSTGGFGGSIGSLGSGGDGGTWSVSNVAPSSLYTASLGGNGGRGGDGSAESGLAGGICGFNPPSSEVLGSPFSFSVFEYGYQMGLNSSLILTPRPIRGGGGGGQGGKPQAGSGNGGGGGGGGGVVLICCAGDVSMKQSIISANGGNGANGSTDPSYTSGGGGGGGGGAVLIRCNSLFIHGLADYGIQVRGGEPGETASAGGHGSYGNIYINTATNAYRYTGGDLGAGSDIALA